MGCAKSWLGGFSHYGEGGTLGAGDLITSFYPTRVGKRIDRQIDKVSVN